MRFGVWHMPGVLEKKKINEIKWSTVPSERSFVMLEIESQVNVLLLKSPLSQLPQRPIKT